MNPQKVIYLLICFLVVVLPLFFNVYSDSEFTFNKTSVFRLFVFIILTVFSYFLFTGSVTSSFCFLDIWRKYKSYFILLISYFIVIALSTIFSQSAHISFFGAERQQGLMQLLFYLILFFIVLTAIERKRIITLFYLISGTSFLISIIGVLEYFEIRPIWFPVYDQGVASTLGHPSFLGAYLAMAIPLTVACFFIASQRIIKLFWLITFSLQFITLLLTKTRAAWIAFGLSLLFMVLLGLIKAQKRVVLGIVSILFIIAAFISLFTGITNRFLNAQEGSGALRLIWWNQAVEAIKERPLLGYGLETQEDILMSKYHPLQAVYSYYGLRTDRAHNEILDQLLTTGILGTLALFLFVAYLYKDGIRSFFQTNDRKKAIMILALLTGILAYFIQGMFSFSVTVLYVYFWLLAEMVVVMAKRKEEKADKQEGRSEPSLRPTVPSEGSGPTRNAINGMKKMISIFGSLISVFLIWFIVLRPAIADVYLKQMESVNLEDRFAQYEIQDLHNKIIFNSQFTSGEIPYRFRYVNIIRELIRREEDTEKQKALFEIAQKELNIIYQKNPKDFNYYPILGELMREWGRIDSTKYPLMNQAFQKAVENNPRYAPFYYLWGRGLREAGINQESRIKLNQALVLSLAPDFPGISENPQWHLAFSRAEIYKALGEIEQQEGNTQKADYYFQISQQLKEIVGN